MAYADTGYNPTASKGSFGAAFLIHAGVIGALILMPSTMMVDGDDGLEIGAVFPTAPPPPPPPPPPEPATQKTTETQVTPVNPRPKPPVNPRPDQNVPRDSTGFTSTTGNIGGLGDFDNDIPIGGTGLDDIGGGATIPDDVIKPKPVFKGPSLNQRYSSAFQPNYPGSLMRREVEGLVTVRVLVGSNGRVKKVERVSATEDAFWKATERQALNKWRFNPATETVGDKVTKVEAWFTVTVQFEIK